jgi:predicted ribosomally synthesized peptide with SipW-like signal peptide
MKKILISVGTIAVVAALAVGGTIAFYSDTETSTGNIFTAGSIDLKIDQTMASYNGENCQTCSLAIVSDATTVVGASPAVVLSFVHPAWTADLDGGHVAGMPNDGANDGSKWIWITDGPTFPNLTQTHTFERSFVWNGTASAATLYLATDNLYTNVNLNGNFIASTADNNNFALATEDVFSNLQSFLVPGVNVLQVTVTNVGGNGNPQANPAGLLFKLKIVGNCQGGNGYINTPGASCELWGLTDLTDEQYFSFGDVKPGDQGTNLISLHVDSNDAYACLIPHDLEDDENVPVDPEITAGDNLLDNPGNGELSDYLEFFLWEDTNADGVYQLLEPVLADAGTTIDQIQTEMIALSLTGGGPTKYIGLAWCAGNQTGPSVALPNTPLVCDGNGMSNKAQTDSLIASLTAYAVQVRNNPNFTCASVGSLDATPAP